MMKKAIDIAKRENLDRIMTYSDTRFGGTCYAVIGMKRLQDTAIRFWWTDFDKRYDRFKFRANKEKNLSEKDVAFAAGVTKIFACKYAKYEIKV